MNFPEIYSATGMMELIQKIGFLPLLDSGIEGFSAEDIVAEDGNPDMEKMDLIVFDPIHHSYIQLGEKVGNAFSDGKALK